MVEIKEIWKALKRLSHFVVNENMIERRINERRFIELEKRIEKLEQIKSK